MSFQALQLSDPLLRAVQAAGYVDPTPIQLRAIPVVLGTGGRPPDAHAEQVWTPFDPQGFAAYRVTLHVLSAAVFVAFYLLLLPLTGPGWALVGCGLAALAPFGVHEVLFTWPKWTATAWLAAAAGPLGSWPL